MEYALLPDSGKFEISFDLFPKSIEDIDNGKAFIQFSLFFCTSEAEKLDIIAALFYNENKKASLFIFIKSF
jgi:hypothetical protein